MTDMESHHDMKQTHEHGEQNTDHVVVEHKHDREHVDHTGHELMFRNRFWVCLVLSIPVLLYSPTIQGWLGFGMPEFTGSEWIVPILSLIIFIIGGGAVLEIGRARDSETKTRDDDADLTRHWCVVPIQLRCIGV